jgi:hypothetical protein
MRSEVRKAMELSKDFGDHIFTSSFFGEELRSDFLYAIEYECRWIVMIRMKFFE